MNCFELPKLSFHSSPFSILSLSLSFFLCTSLTHPRIHFHTLLPQAVFYPSLMFPIPIILPVIVLMMVVVVSGDDTQAFRDTLSSLCSLNKAGKFSTCCASHDINSLTLEYSPARNCFILSLSSSSGSVLNSLFVVCFILDLFILFHDCHSFPSCSIPRSFSSKDLSVLGKGVFSSLTNLKSLFSLLLTLSSIHFFLHSFPSFLSFAIQQSCFT